MGTKYSLCASGQHERYTIHLYVTNKGSCMDELNDYPELLRISEESPLLRSYLDDYRQGKITLVRALAEYIRIQDRSTKALKTLLVDMANELQAMKGPIGDKNPF